jgi:hypothetical protein
MFPECSPNPALTLLECFPNVPSSVTESFQHGLSAYIAKNPSKMIAAKQRDVDRRLKGKAKSGKDHLDMVTGDQFEKIMHMRFMQTLIAPGR